MDLKAGGAVRRAGAFEIQLQGGRQLKRTGQRSACFAVKDGERQVRTPDIRRYGQGEGIALNGDFPVFADGEAVDGGGQTQCDGPSRNHRIGGVERQFFPIGFLLAESLGVAGVFEFSDPFRISVQGAAGFHEGFPVADGVCEGRGGAGIGKDKGADAAEGVDIVALRGVRSAHVVLSHGDRVPELYGDRVLYAVEFDGGIAFVQPFGVDRGGAGDVFQSGGRFKVLVQIPAVERPVILHCFGQRAAQPAARVFGPGDRGYRIAAVHFKGERISRFHDHGIFLAHRLIFFFERGACYGHLLRTRGGSIRIEYGALFFHKAPGAANRRGIGDLRVGNILALRHVDGAVLFFCLRDLRRPFHGNEIGCQRNAVYGNEIERRAAHPGNLYGIAVLQPVCDLGQRILTVRIQFIQSAIYRVAFLGDLIRSQRSVERCEFHAVNRSVIKGINIEDISRPFQREQSLSLI